MALVVESVLIHGATNGEVENRESTEGVRRDLSLSQIVNKVSCKEICLASLFRQSRRLAGHSLHRKDMRGKRRQESKPIDMLNILVLQPSICISIPFQARGSVEASKRA
jgi:hypothetical protein